MTGSSLPCAASSVRSRPYFSQRLVLVLRVLVGHAVGAAHVLDGAQQRLAVGAGGAQRVAGRRLGLGQREQQVLGGDVLVLERARLLLGGAQHLHEAGGGVRCRRVVAGDRGKGIERGVDRGAQRARVGAELVQHGSDDPGLLLEQHGQQVLGHELGVAALLGEPLGGLQRLLGLDREAVWVQIWPFRRHKSQS